MKRRHTLKVMKNVMLWTIKVPPKCILGLELAKDGKKNKKK